MEATRESTEIPDYVGMLRRRWWILLICSAIGGIAGLGITAQLTKVYESSTSVLVQPATQDTNVVGGRTRSEINLDTEAQLVRSTAVAAGAASLLRSAESPDRLAADVSVEVPPNTSVLVINYSANTAEAAQAGSHAFAEAYLRNRETSARADLNAQIDLLSAKVRQLNSTLAGVNNRLARIDRNSAERPNLESQRATTTNQLNSLAGKLNQLTTATVSAGKIISDARLPSRPSKPNRGVNIGTGAMLGLLLGLGPAALRERMDRRIRRASDVWRRLPVPVLAELGRRAAPRFDDICQPYGPAGRTFNRLRNEVLASLDPGAQIVVVTGASRGPGATLVAANLAAALARTGSEVILVGAQLPESVTGTAALARIVGVAPTPGLSDVLAGRLSLDEVIQRAPRNPWLRVITTGGTATAAGLMQSQALRDALDVLRTQAHFVIIEAPSTSTSADAQSLASLADAAIVTVELRRTLRPDVQDAAEQLRRVGTPLLGAVVLPKLRASAPVVPPAPLPGRPTGPITLPRTAEAGLTADPRLCTDPRLSTEMTQHAEMAQHADEPQRAAAPELHEMATGDARPVDTDQTAILTLTSSSTDLSGTPMDRINGGYPEDLPADRQSLVEGGAGR